MTWQSEKTIHRFSIDYVSGNGKRQKNYEEYEIDKWGSSEITIHLCPGDKNFTIKPQVVEMLKHPVNLEYEIGNMTRTEMTITELFAGILDGTKVAWLGYLRQFKGLPGLSVAQYLFDDNEKPYSSKFGMQAGPGWPSSECAVIDDKMKPYFSSLKILRPTAASSIDKCVELLSKPMQSFSPAHWE